MDILKNIFETSLGVSVLIAILLLLRPLLSRRYHAKWQYWAWLVLAVRLAIPFGLPQMPAVLTVQVANPSIYTRSDPVLPSAAPIISDTQDTASAPTLPTPYPYMPPVTPRTLHAKHGRPCSLSMGRHSHRCVISAI